MQYGMNHSLLCRLRVLLPHTAMQWCGSGLLAMIIFLSASRVHWLQSVLVIATCFAVHKASCSSVTRIVTTHALGWSVRLGRCTRFPSISLDDFQDETRPTCCDWYRIETNLLSAWPYAGSARGGGWKNRPAPFPGRMSQKVTKTRPCLSCLLA